MWPIPVADTLFAYSNPYECIIDARISESPDRRQVLADCLSRSRSPAQAVRALDLAGFDVNWIIAREIERRENSGNREAAAAMLRDMVLAPR